MSEREEEKPISRDEEDTSGPSTGEAVMLHLEIKLIENTTGCYVNKTALRQSMKLCKS